ncbi:MAG: ABC transporter permease [Acidobacteriota bacterium]
MAHDVRMALRSLLRRPAFTAAAVLTLGLAAAANAGILAIVYGVLLKPLPFQDPDRLVAVWPGRFQSNADLLLVRERGAMFSGVAAVAPGWTMSLTGSGEPRKVTVARVSGNLFDTLGVRPLLGRALREEDARKGSDSVVVLTYDLWRTQFAADRSIVGRTVRLEGEPFEVVGVLPRGFEVFGLKTDAFTPFALDAAAWYHQLSFSMFVARLAPGRALEQANRDYRALIFQIRSTRKYPDDYGRTAHLENLRTAVVGDVSAALLVLAAAVGLILVIAGANVGTLLLARVAARSREIAVRAAVGASRARIARELVAEGVLVALTGGVLGTVAAWIALPSIIALLPDNTPRTGDIAIDTTVITAVLLASTVIDLAFSLVPALASLRVRTAALLRAGTHSESYEAKRTRGLLISGEIALALVLSIAAGLMAQSLVRLQRLNPGFSPEGVLTLHLQPTGLGSKDGRPVAVYYASVIDRFRAVSGVTSVGAIQHLPFSGYSWNGAIDVEGHAVPSGTSRPTAGMRIVTPGYFRAIGQPLLAGRDFEWPDTGRSGSLIVNETLARKFFGRSDAALGRRIRIRGGGIQSAWMIVGGVVADVHHTSLTDPVMPEIYTPASGDSIPAMMLAIRTGADPLSIVPAVRDAIWSIDRNVPISDIETMAAKIGGSLSRPRLLVIVLSVFAAAGLLLALTGVYGVVAYSVTQRRREIGIMMALGAERARVIRSVLREGLAYGAAGLLVGIPAALAANRLLRSLLYGIAPTDPVTYAVLSVAILIVISAASWVPAARAARIDPIAAMREE